MGSAVSASTSPEDFYAYKVVKEYYEAAKVAIDAKVEEAVIYEDQAALYTRLELIYMKARELCNTPIHECYDPAVLAAKYLALSEEEKDAYNNSVHEAIEAKHKANKPKASKKATDYSLSFGGTEADSKAEKEAAEFFRGGSVEADEDNPYLKKPTVTNQFDIWRLRSIGKWKKYMGSGCYMYIHCLTRENLSVRPEDYVEEEDTSADNKAGEETIDPANGLPVVELADLPEEIDRIINEMELTPLIIDTSPEQNVRTFYTYKGVLEDVSGLSIPFAKSGLKRNDVVERCRKKLVQALKTGNTFVLYLGGCTIEHADWKTKLCKKDTFPSEVFRNGGRKLLQPEYEPKYKPIFREEDLEAGQIIVRDGFKAVFITTLDPYEFKEKLEASIPLGYMQPIYVKS